MVAAIQNGYNVQGYQQPQQVPYQQPINPGYSPGQYQQQGEVNQAFLNPSIANQQAVWLAQQAQQSSGLTHQQQFYPTPQNVQIPAIQQAVLALKPYVNSLEQMAQVANAQAVYIEGMREQLNEYDRLAKIGYVAIESLYSALNQLKAMEELHQALLNCVNSPEWMLFNTFDMLQNVIQGNDDTAVEVISQLYLELQSTFEEKKRQLTGNYTPGYTNYLNQIVNQGTNNLNNQQQRQSENYQPMRDLSRAYNYQPPQNMVDGIKQLSARLNQRII